MNNSENTRQVLEQLYSDREQTGDAVFNVEGQQIRAHRLILAALSPKYKAQFFGPNPDQGETCIPNVPAAAFKVFIQMFYKESVDLTMDNIEAVLDLAKQSLVDGFVEICVDFLKKSITTSNVCFVYRLTILYEIESIRRVCEQVISSKTMDVFASDGFLHCSHEVLVHILNLDTVNCPESDVFNACIAWARADCNQKGLDEKKPEHLRAALSDAIYQVRFSSINAKELAAVLHGSLNGFFAADELVELLAITSKMDGFTSQKFNQTARTQSRNGDLKAIVGSKVWSLECDRFVERIGNDRVNTNKTSENEISCNKLIRLYGFAIGFNLTENALNLTKSRGTVEINIQQFSGSFTDLTLRCKFYEGMNETIVMFDRPIEKIKGFVVTSSFSAFKINGKLVLKDQIVVDNNIFTCSGEMVTRFFFDNI